MNGPGAWTLTVAFLFALGKMDLPAQETGQAAGLWPNSAEACRELGRWVCPRGSPLCHRPAHWVVGVDISGSTQWGWLDVARDLLRDWIGYVVVPGDRVTLIAFDDEVRTFGPWDVQDRAALLTTFLDPLRVREGRSGSAVDRAREKALELAAQAARASPGRVACTLLFADRDSTDSLPGARTPATASLTHRFGSQFVLWPAGKDAQVVERETELKIVCRDGQKIASPIVFHSLARRAEAVPMSANLLPRRIPASTNVPPPPPPPPDPWKWMRQWLWLATFGVGLLALFGLGGWLWSAEGGKLTNLDKKQSSSLPWRPFRQREKEVRATHHGPGFCLSPQRQGMEDGLVLRAKLHNPFAWKPWSVQLTALGGYNVRQGAGSWSDKLVLETGEQAIEVKDSNGIVARGKVAFAPDQGTHRVWQAFIVGAGVWLVLLLTEPFLLAALPVPLMPMVEQPQPELLCE